MLNLARNLCGGGGGAWSCAPGECSAATAPAELGTPAQAVPVAARTHSPEMATANDVRVEIELIGDPFFWFFVVVSG